MSESGSPVEYTAEQLITYNNKNKKAKKRIYYIICMIMVFFSWGVSE